MVDFKRVFKVSDVTKIDVKPNMFEQVRLDVSKAIKIFPKSIYIIEFEYNTRFVNILVDDTRKFIN